MEATVVECEVAERDAGMCACRGATLHVLKDVQRAYEERMEIIDRTAGPNKLQMQVEVLQSWVGDLVGQNTLLARAVEDLETEATTRLVNERRRHSELQSELRAECQALRRRLGRKDADLRGLVEVLRRLREFDYCTLDGIHFHEVTESDIFGSVEWRQKKLGQGDVRRNFHQNPPNKPRDSRYIKIKDKTKMTCDKLNELKIMVDSLQKENRDKDREIRRLNKDVQQYEQTIINLRAEMSLTNYHTPEVSKKDAEVMAGMCCTGTECGEMQPVKDYTVTLREETMKYQNRLRQMEVNLKSSGDSVRNLRKINVSLNEQLHDLGRVCAVLDEECRLVRMRAQFKDDIIREMRRQLRQVKAKLTNQQESQSNPQKDYVSGDHDYVRCSNVSYDSVSIACVRQQPRRKRNMPPAMDTPVHPYSDSDCQSPRLNGSGDDICKT